MLSADLTHLPTRPGDWQRLLEAIYNADPTDERDELEWKSTLDVASRTGQFHIARFILAAANRDPDASANFDGHAVMIVGLAPGRVEGITPVDTADFAPKIRRYVGETIGFEPHYLTYRDASILAITVSPPRPGDPLFPLRRSTDGAQQGTIYRRRDTKTAPANAEGIDALSRRAADAPKHLELDVQLNLSEPLGGSTWSPDVATRWADRERDRLTEAHDSPPISDRRLVATRSLRASALHDALMGDLPEDRKPQQYADQIEAYTDEIVRQFDEAVRRYLAVRGPHTTVTITNPTDRNLEDVKVEIYIPGGVWSYRHTSRRQPRLEWLLPNPPRPWGPRPYEHQTPTYTYQPSSTASGPSVMTQNGGSTTLTVNVPHLRPGEIFTTGDNFRCFLVAVGKVPPLLRARWTASATNQDGVDAGELVVPTSPGVADATDQLFTALGLER